MGLLGGVDHFLQLTLLPILVKEMIRKLATACVMLHVASNNMWSNLSIFQAM